MAQKKRIRDILFPEGGKIRSWLRTMNRLFKSICSLTYLKEQKDKIKEKGWRVTWTEMKRYMIMGTLAEPQNIYQKWIELNEPKEEELEKQCKMKFKNNPRISIIIPMYNTPVKFFEELVDSLIEQTYTNWELCLADGSNEKNEKLKSIYEKDERIKYKFLGENKGISGNTNEALALATGDYKIRIESFGSSDGIYYGLTASDMIELDLRIINSSYGLKVTTGDTFKIIDKDTGFTENDNNTLTSLIEYSSGLSDPNIAISLYRRDYSETFSQDYNLVDLADYVKDYLSPTARNNEYVVTNSPTSSINHTLLLKSNLTTGTYKLVYKLYDGDNYVGEAYEYMVIK